MRGKNKMLTEEFKRFVRDAKERFHDDEAVISVIEEMERDLAKVEGSSLTLSVLVDSYDNVVDKMRDE